MDPSSLYRPINIHLYRPIHTHRRVPSSSSRSLAALIHTPHLPKAKPFRRHLPPSSPAICPAFTQYTMTISARIAGDGQPTGSASSIIAGAVSGYHLLRIVGYSRTKEVPNGEWIDSCPFGAGGRTWHVRYYPNGDSKNVDFISLFLTLDDTLAEAETVKAQGKFSLLDQHGKPVPDYTKTTSIRDFAVGSDCWGFGKFMGREALEKSEHLKDDSFTVKVDVNIMGECHTQEAPAIVVPPSDMHLHFGDLLSSKACVDVEFRVAGETFSAHRSVLAARSPVFRAQFCGPMKEGTSTDAIHIDDMEARVFSALLSFIYTDALPEMKQDEESAMAQHLLVAADKYGLDRLKLICEDKLSSDIDTSSVATILALAEQHHCCGLKAACLAFLGSPMNLDAAIKSEGFEFLTKSCPGVLKDFLISHVVPSLLGKRKSGA
ncbi:BTB/POZ and MATH domain-containing protein 1-like [Lolium rigidum]|uniref:BTB/POZ and MATH domain-containing protein 1-like n=1 Tax=Lolium rigidum TaxID=89674 RepID=UPI001F5C1670|nr:BTB/POZ and MATH domain-containing protein 1-like [Lolium rigidum]